MGAIERVLSDAWQQRQAIMRKRPDMPSLCLYLDTQTYMECVCDAEAFRYSLAGDGHADQMAGMRVYRVLTDERHVRVAVDAPEA